MSLSANDIWYADHRAALGQRTPVLMIHGAGGTHLDWPAELRRLPEANALVLDLPGHGRSPGPARRSVAEYAADISAFMSALKLEQAILLGHSLGGAVAMSIALAAPRSVAGLILIATGAKLSVHPELLGRLVQEREKAVAMLVDWQWARGFDEAKKRSRERLLALDPQVLLGDFEAANAFDIRDRLSEIHARTLIIGGSADQMTPPRYSAYLRQHLPDSRLVMVEGGGHMLMLEQPQVVANAVRQWLEKHG